MRYDELYCRCPISACTPNRARRARECTLTGVPFGGSRATDPCERQTYLCAYESADASGHLNRAALRDDWLGVIT